MTEPTSSQPTSDASRDDELLAELADDFARRYRRGEHPSLDEYARQHPSLAEKIRDLFPAMLAMEQPDVTPPAERPGVTIGRYKLLERIGEGGYGVVFMAEQTSPVHRKVALKIIKAGMDTRQVIARFEAERQALALMDHPNIAKVFDAGTTDTGRPYFVMELVKGMPITKYCDERRLTPQQRLELFVQVCQAVQHAHQKGIIHRDIKPNNVLVALYDGKPVPKVIDFGVAKATGQQLTERTMFTGFGDVVGTLEYMSPEQAELNQLDIDTRSDIYALGVLLYELLTGTTPIEHKRASESALLEVLRLIREEEPPKPSTRLSTVAELPSIAAQRGLEPKKLSGLVRGELDWIVMKALEKDRSRRYETANGLGRDVERYLHDEQVLACPASTGYRLRKFVSRNKGRVIAVAAVVAALVAGLAAATAGFINANHQRHLAEASQAVEAQQRRRAETEARNAQVARAQSIFEQANALHLASRGQESRAAYLRAHEEFARLGLSTLPTEIALLRSFRAFTAPINTLTGHTKALMAVAFAPDGLHAFSASEDKKVFLWDTRTGYRLRTFIGHDAPVLSLAVSPDGTRLLSGGGDARVILWDVATAKPLRTLHVKHEARGVAFSPDGALGLSTAWDRHLRLWDLTTGRELRSIAIAEGSGNLGTVVFSPDAERALVAAYDGGVCVFDLRSGTRVAHLTGHSDWAVAAVFSPDGKRVLSASYDRTARLWDLATAQTIHTFTHSEPVRGVAFAPDGSFAISGSLDGTMRLWDVKTGSQSRVFAGHEGGIRGISISPDGRRAISAGVDSTARVWDLNAVDVLSVQSRHTTPRFLCPAIDVAADGRTFLCGEESNRAALYDTATLKLLRAYPLKARAASVAFLADGKRFLTSPPTVIRDLRSGASLHVYPDRSTHQVASNGRIALAATLPATTSELWDVDNGKALATLPLDIAAARFTFSPDGTRALSAHNSGTLCHWDLQSATRLFAITPHGKGQVCAAAFSPDGTRALTGGQDLIVRLWELSTAQPIRDFKGSVSNNWDVAFSRDGRAVYAADQSRILRMWDAGSGELLDLDARHPSPINKLITVADTDVLLTVTNGAVYRWDFSRAARYLRFATTLQAARDALARDPDDAGALAVFGQWYAFRGIHDWAVELLENAKARGAEISHVELARCYWQLDKRADAAREFRGAIQRQEAPAGYLTLCLKAVEDPQSNKAATTQGVERTGLPP